MKQQWSHHKDVAGRGRAQDIAPEWDLEDLRSRKNPAEVTRRNDAESARVTVGQVKVKAQGNQLSERVSGWLCVRDSSPDAVLSPRVVGDRQDTVLVTGHGPIGSRVLVEIGRVDRKCVIAKQT